MTMRSPSRRKPALAPLRNGSSSDAAAVEAGCSSSLSPEQSEPEESISPTHANSCSRFGSVDSIHERPLAKLQGPLRPLVLNEAGAGQASSTAARNSDSWGSER